MDISTVKEQNDSVISPIEFALFAQPTNIITTSGFFDRMNERYIQKGLAKKGELDSLRMFMPQERELFLPVPPKPNIPLESKDKCHAAFNDFIQKLSFHGKQCINENDPECLLDLDVIKVPGCPYVALSVNDGRAMLNVIPNTAQALLKEKAFMWWEGFCLCLVSPVLAFHGIDCAGSRYGETCIPCFILRDGVLVFTHHQLKGKARPDCGAAFCEKRIAATV